MCVAPEMKKMVDYFLQDLVLMAENYLASQSSGKKS
jgi:hypothetical protein